MSTSDHGAAAKFTAKCRLCWPWAKNTLVGFASIEIAEIGLTIHDVAIHEKGSVRWARIVRDAFSAVVIKVVLQHTPNAFAGGASS